MVSERDWPHKDVSLIDAWQEHKDTINEHQNKITAGNDHIICLVTVELMQHVLISENEDGTKAGDDMDGAEGDDDAAENGPEDKAQKAEDVAEVHVKDVAHGGQGEQCGAVG